MQHGERALSVLERGFAEAKQDLVYVGTDRREFAQRYLEWVDSEYDVERWRPVHFHVRFVGRVKEGVPDLTLCIVLRTYARARDEGDVPDLAGAGESKLRSSRGGGLGKTRVDHAVLVRDVEFVEQVQGVASGPLPVVVGLKVVDELPVVLVDANEASIPIRDPSASGLSVSRLTLRDGEHPVSVHVQRVGAIEDRELMDEVVERATEVVRDISDDDAEPEVENRVAEQLAEFAAGLRISATTQPPGFDLVLPEFLQRRAEKLEVRTGACGFEFAAVETVNHAR